MSSGGDEKKWHHRRCTETMKSGRGMPLNAKRVDEFIAPCKVRVGNVETSNGGRQVFGAVMRTDTDIAVLIRRSLKAVGRSNDTELIASSAAARVCDRFWPRPAS